MYDWTKSDDHFLEIEVDSERLIVFASPIINGNAGNPTTLYYDYNSFVKQIHHGSGKKKIPSNALNALEEIDTILITLDLPTAPERRSDLRLRDFTIETRNTKVIYGVLVVTHTIKGTWSY